MRPRYESEKDRGAEQEIAAAIEQAWNLRLHKLPDSYSLDFMGTDYLDQLDRWIEIKDRAMSWGQYPSIMLSLGKLNSAVDLMRTTKREAWFVVRDNAGDIRAAKLSQVVGRPELIRFAGRTKQTRDSADVEPTVYIPAGNFVAV